MKSRCLVHIGYHKTATTWLQRELFSSASGEFYPLSHSDGPKYLGDYFVYDDSGYLLSPFKSRKDDLLAAFDAVQGSRGSDDRIGVISNERLSGNPHSGGFDAKLIADRIYESLPNATIFIVIRRQADMVLSVYLQYLKIGGTDSLQNYLHRPYDGKRPGFSPGYLDYWDLVNYYVELFGKDQVLVLPYEQFRETPEEFLRKIGSALSIEAELQVRTADKVHNKHLRDFIRIRFPSLNAFAIRSSVNGYSPLRVPGFDRALRFASRSLGKLSDRMTAKLRGRMIALAETHVGDRYAEGNKLLSSRIDIDLSRYGYHD